MIVAACHEEVLAASSRRRAPRRCGRRVPHRYHDCDPVVGLHRPVLASSQNLHGHGRKGADPGTCHHDGDLRPCHPQFTSSNNDEAAYHVHRTIYQTFGAPHRNTDIRNTDIQRKAREQGVTISPAYISEMRQTFLREQSA